jgi:ankyrin repeat protein
VNVHKQFISRAKLFSARFRKNQLFEKGADINEKEIYGQTALMEASYNGDCEIVKLLIKKNSNVNAIDNNKE